MNGTSVESLEGSGADASELNLGFVIDLYRKYAEDLRTVRGEQQKLRAANPDAATKLDDLEAEITYLMVREHRPEVVVEIGSLDGWSTTWLLRALRDNGTGHLYTYDLVDNARNNVPEELAADRWTFVHGDAREKLAGHDHEIDYLFVDAAHTRNFARWYVNELFPTVPPGVPVSVHDVFHTRRPWPFSEGRVVLSWLADRGIEYFTASRAAAPQVNQSLFALKETLDLSEAVHSGRNDPMLCFYMN
ncbi:class I SAM-dependent methyltransferase [Sphaerisporangium perillae]|uniref:class I SAM-dependent methyltransferase n=1 Tax=Sphaerisporangium perillae TaxID=2935860 RepID=UPI00200FFBC2|nr:class I SAM-dependent methyltransferase [Sphaerisporangium perillae]